MAWVLWVYLDVICCQDVLMLCWSYKPDDRPDFSKLLKTLERLPKKRLARSPSHPVQLSRSAESVFWSCDPTNFTVACAQVKITFTPCSNSWPQPRGLASHRAPHSKHSKIFVTLVDARYVEKHWWGPEQELLVWDCYPTVLTPASRWCSC